MESQGCKEDQEVLEPRASKETQDLKAGQEFLVLLEREATVVILVTLGPLASWASLAVMVRREVWV